VKRTFKEFPAFTRLVKSKRLPEEEVERFQLAIMAGAGTTIPGTGGVKKIRGRRGHGGKSGGWRVLFADYDRLGLTFLIWAFPKGIQADLTEAQKKTIRQLKRAIDQEVQK